MPNRTWVFAITGRDDSGNIETGIFVEEGVLNGTLALAKAIRGFAEARPDHPYVTHSVVQNADGVWQ